MTICKMFIGLPASGKSTIVETIKKPGDWVYSTDNYIETVAASQDKSYDDVFADAIKQASSEMNKYLTVAIATSSPIIWDQTNLSSKKRKKVINRLRCHGYSIEAYYIVVPTEIEDITEWNSRLHSRKGKNIPDHIITNMLNSFESPTMAEGFSNIYSYNIYGERYEFES